jgi:uncharacterized membrane protein YbhN (UPF0104 family)
LLSGLTGAGILVALVVLLLLPTLYLAAVGRGHTPLATFTGRTRWHDRLQSGVATLRDSETAMARFLRHSPGMLLLAVGLALLTWGLMIGEFWLMVAYLGAPLTPIQLIVTLTAARLAILLFLPGGLGVLEASQVMAFGLMGLNPAVGVSAGLLIRARDVSLGAAGLWWGSRKLDQVRGADALSLPSPIEDVAPAPGTLPAAPLQPGTRPQKSS